MVSEGGYGHVDTAERATAWQSPTSSENLVGRPIIVSDGKVTISVSTLLRQLFEQQVQLSRLYDCLPYEYVVRGQHQTGGRARP